MLHGIEVDEDKLQSDKVSMEVSRIGKDADNSKLYIFAKTLINNFKNQYNIILSGRDLMKVYPELNYHFFITASLEERVKRKANQYMNKEDFITSQGPMDLEKLRLHIQKRDELQEQAGFYKRYPITIDIDVSDCKSAKESAEKLIKYINI